MGYQVDINLAQVLIALGGLFIQAIAGWAWLQVLRNEVSRLRDSSEKHAVEIAAIKATQGIFEKRLDKLEEV